MSTLRPQSGGVNIRKLCKLDWIESYLLKLNHLLRFSKARKIVTAILLVPARFRCDKYHG